MNTPPPSTLPCWGDQALAGSAVFGGVVWGIALLLILPQPFDTAWAKLMLLLGPLVLVPLGLRLVARLMPGGPPSLWRAVILVQPLAALSLGAALLLGQGPLAAALAVPWFLTTGLIALLGVRRMRYRREELPQLCVDVGLIYIAIGGCWALVDRWGLQPLAFQPVIVLLTGIHFHYAGFALPLLTGFAFRQRGSTIARLAGWGVIVAVPLVAVGITSTQLHFPPIWEAVSAWLMALTGVLVGSLYLRLAAEFGRASLARVGWTIAGLSLIGGMLLAGLYGLRFYLPLAWLDIPWMRAFHGTANALGFGLIGLLSWSLVSSEHPRRS